MRLALRGDQLVGWGCMFVALSACCLKAQAEQVTLTGKGWTVSIEPETLAVDCVPQGAKALPLSAPRRARTPVENLHHDGLVARWFLPADRTNIQMALDDDVLDVRLTTDSPGQVTWPILEANPAIRAYILPMFEGVHVPTDDSEWTNFLIRQGPLDTTAGLSMPFWGLDCGTCTLTYVITNPFNNQLAWARDHERLTARLTHEFPPNAKPAEFGLRIYLGTASPVEPAKIYRKYLNASNQFVSLREKIARTPNVAKLLGAAHVYLWGEGLIARSELARLKELAGRIVDRSKSTDPSVERRLWDLMGSEARQILKSIPSKAWVDNYDKSQIAEELSRLLERGDFYAADSWRGVSLPDETQTMLETGMDALSEAEVCRLNCRMLHAAFSDLLPPVETWGDGLSPKMIAALAEAGLDRLWLGSATWKGLGHHPETVRQALTHGYLICPYDSYHSIHSPRETDTWETAQFDQQLYDTGAVIRRDGTKRKGFKQKGYMLSPRAARPYVERRVTELMRQFRCNSWFIDCDAFGDVFDDYSPLHPATQAEDMQARLARMAWIRDNFGAVIGSEGGSAYAAATIHFAHGIMTPVIGWGDPDLRNRQSPYFLGAYYPPDAPAIFFKSVPLKPKYRRVYADPRFRLPLYELVFHDSVVATHQWGYGSLKFTDEQHTRELLELLYCVPPLYHLNLDTWQQRQAEITAHYRFFSPLHRAAGSLPMTDFAWLSEDHMVQRTVFGDELELVANFGPRDYSYRGEVVPPHSILAALLRDGSIRVYPSTASP